MSRNANLIIFAAFSQAIGTALYVTCSFAGGIILLRETHSLWIYALNAFIASCSVAFLGPLMGVLSDRYGRSRLILTLGLTLTVWIIIAINFLERDLFVFLTLITTSVCCALTSALSVVSISTPRLQDPAKIGHGLGTIQIAEQLSKVAAPLLIVVIQPLEFFHFFIAIGLFTGTQVLLTFAYHSSVTHREQQHIESPVRKNTSAVTVRNMLKLVMGDRTLKIFAPYLTISTACVELAAIALTPIVLSYANEHELGIAFVMANISAVLGSLCISRFNSYWNRLRALKIFLLIEGIGSVLFLTEALTSSLIVFTIALVMGFFIMPASIIAAQFVWLGDTPLEQQGLISGLERLSSWLLVPFAFLLTPLLATESSGNNLGIDVGSLREIAMIAAIILGISTLIASYFLLWISPQRQTLR